MLLWPSMGIEKYSWILGWPLFWNWLGTDKHTNWNCGARRRRSQSSRQFDGHECCCNLVYQKAQHKPIKLDMFFFHGSSHYSNLTFFSAVHITLNKIGRAEDRDRGVNFGSGLVKIHIPNMQVWRQKKFYHVEWIDMTYRTVTEDMEDWKTVHHTCISSETLKDPGKVCSQWNRCLVHYSQKCNSPVRKIFICGKWNLAGMHWTHPPSGRIRHAVILRIGHECTAVHL